MKINYISNQQIDKNKWDRCIIESLSPMVYGMSWYLDVVANSKWDALILGDYQMVFPIPYRRNIFLQNEIIQPIFCQQHGLFSKFEITNDVLLQFLNNIPNKFKNVILKLNEKNNIISHPKLSVTNQTNILLDLNHSYEYLKTKYSKNLKRNLKKSNRFDLIFSKDINVETAYNFYFEHRGNKLNFSRKVKNNLLNLFKTLNNKGFSEIVGVFEGTQLLAVVFFIRFKNRLTYFIPPSSPEGKQKSAMHFLIDKIIQEYASQDMILDFEGSNVESIARFYKSFGGTNNNYQLIKTQL